MKILLLSQFFSTTRGGGEYIFSFLAKKLAEDNNKVWIITNEIIGEKYSKQKNVKIIFVSPKLEYKGGLPPSFFQNIIYAMNSIRIGFKLIKQENIELIHSNNFSPAVAGSVLSTFTKKPHITSIWDIFTLCGKDYWSRWAKQNNVSKINAFLGPRFEKLILKLNHDIIHTISEASKQDLIKFGAKKPIHVIPPTIEVKDEITVQSNPFQFIYVGRLVFYKNLEVVIKAINIVKQKIPQVKLIIIGSGPHKNTLESLVKSMNLESNIDFRGYVDADEKLKLIKESAALVFPSLCEGFGLVILEAFSQSKPVLVSNVRPMSDIIIDGNTGYILDPHNESIWADYLLKILQDKESAFRMGKNGNDLLNSSYTESLMYQKIVRMYNDVLENN